MHPFPHHYAVTASAEANSPQVVLESAGIPRLTTASPREFDGPGDQWSPEAMLAGAVADCFALSFRAVASASKLPWTALTCAVKGTLDRVDNVTRFTAFDVNATLLVPPGTDVERAHRLLEKAERICLITNSLNAPAHLHARVEVSDAQPAPSAAS
jgi:organic hydroperoxide reductase OsmC/OhrA